MNANDAIFVRALSKMLVEIFDGPPGNEAFVLNPGDPGLVRQLDAIDGAAASARPMPGKTTIAAHVDHLRIRQIHRPIGDFDDPLAFDHDMMMFEQHASFEVEHVAALKHGNGHERKILIESLWPHASHPSRSACRRS